MAMQHSNIADALTPSDYGKMLDTEIDSQSIAFNTSVSTVHPTNSVKVHFPLWTADMDAAWVAELGTIPSSDGTTSEVTVIPTKVAAITRASSESVADSDPSIAEQIAKGLARQISDGIDVSLLGNTTTNGPSGLLSTAYSTVDTGASIVNLDPFLAGVFAAEAVGASLSAWIINPTQAEILSKIKVATADNRTLLSYDNRGLTIAGLPVIISRHVDATTKAWGVSASRNRTVRRLNTEIVRSRDSAFNVDAVDLRGVARVGFGFLQPAANVRLYDAA